MIDLVKAYEQDCKVAEEMILKHQQLYAQFVVYAADEVIPVVVPDYGKNGETRSRGRMVVRLLCAAHDAVAVSFTIEAWAATEYAGRETGLRPAEREDKREAVVVQMEYRLGDEVKQRACCREILRDGDDASITGLGPDYAGSDYTGFAPLGLLLPQRMRLPAVRAAAKSELLRMGMTR